MALFVRPSRREDRTGTGYSRHAGDGGNAVHTISTGAARKGTLDSGGLYRRQMNEPVLDFIEVKNPGRVPGNVERLGGKITIPETDIPGAGHVAMIRDTEGNMIGIWKPARKLAGTPGTQQVLCQCQKKGPVSCGTGFRILQNAARSSRW